MRSRGPTPRTRPSSRFVFCIPARSVHGKVPPMTPMRLDFQDLRGEKNGERNRRGLAWPHLDEAIGARRGRILTKLQGPGRTGARSRRFHQDAPGLPIGQPQFCKTLPGRPGEFQSRGMTLKQAEACTLNTFGVQASACFSAPVLFGRTTLKFSCPGSVVGGEKPCNPSLPSIRSCSPRGTRRGSKRRACSSVGRAAAF